MRNTSLTLIAVAAIGSGAAFAQAPPSNLDPATTPLASGRGAIGIEALLMWFKASPTPVPIITDFIYGAPGTNVLLGGGTFDTNPNPGFRLTGAYAVDARWGFEAVAFYAPSRSASRSVSSSGQLDSTDLLLPFYDVNLNRESFTEISFSPIYSGEAKETLSTRFGGGELNARWTLAPQGGWRTELVAGFRYLQLKEDYAITTSSPYIPPNRVDIWTTTDQFDANNRFYGAQVGLRAWYGQGPWVGGLSGKLALGTMQQRVSINGVLSTNDFNDFAEAQTFSGGYFALPTNMGTHARNAFAVVPEVALSIGYQFTSAATLHFGYTFLYASNVLRPGEQINRNINPSGSLAYGGDPPVQPSGPALPSFSFNNSDFWAQSLRVGLTYRF